MYQNEIDVKQNFFSDQNFVRGVDGSGIFQELFKNIKRNPVSSDKIFPEFLNNLNIFDKGFY